MPRRLRWAVGLTVVAIALIVGFIMMIVPEDPQTHVNSVHRVIQGSPVRIIGMAIAGLAVLALMGLGLLEAFDATEHPERHHENE